MKQCNPANIVQSVAQEDTHTKAALASGKALIVSFIYIHIYVCSDFGVSLGLRDPWLVSATVSALCPL